MNFSIECKDAVDWLAAMPSESADLVVTDPAYESLEKHRAKGTTTRLAQSSASSNKWFPIFKNDRFPELFTQLFRVLVRQSSNAGELVIDPFAGSASTGQAALLSGRRFSGCDVKQSAVDAGLRRLAETPFLEAQR